MHISQQPSMFLSHGTIYEAFKNNQLKEDFINIRKEYLRNTPSAIVIFSGHWETEVISVTTGETMVQLDEGFPTEFRSEYKTVGEPLLANRILGVLSDNCIEAIEAPHRGLDHGALIALLLLYPTERIPVVQVSLQNRLDPNYHRRIGEMLSPLRKENVLFLGSGGVVHNRDMIQRFAGQEIEPDHWAKEFDDFISEELAVKSVTNHTDKLLSAYNHKFFKKAHPRSEHYLPLVIISSLGGQPRKVYQAFQWKNLSMSAFLFE